MLVSWGYNYTTNNFDRAVIARCNTILVSMYVNNLWPILYCNCGCITIVFFFAAYAAILPGFQECILNDHHYTIGQVFHPVVEVNGTNVEAVCFNCECMPVSKVNRYLRMRTAQRERGRADD